MAVVDSRPCPGESKSRASFISDSNGLSLDGNTAADPLSCRYFGHFEIGRTLGKGSFGKVCLATDVLTKKQIIDHSTIRSDRERKNVLRELRLLKILSHPHIIRVDRIVEGREFTAIIMELAGRGELYTHVKSRMKASGQALGEAEARRYFKQLVSALDYLHQSSIVHRDVKPENLLLDSEDNLKLVDFGLANTYSSQGYLSTFCGSPYYAAPEMSRGTSYTGPEVDVWSLGVVLYYMVVGSCPFNGKSLDELYNNIGRGNYAYPGRCTLGREIKDLISGALQTSIHARYTLKQIKQHPWVIQDSVAVDPRVPKRPVTIGRLDEVVMAEVHSLGYDRRECENAFKNANYAGPIKSMYYLHAEYLKRTLAARGSGVFYARDAGGESEHSPLPRKDTEVCAMSCTLAMHKSKIRALWLKLKKICSFRSAKIHTSSSSALKT